VTHLLQEIIAKLPEILARECHKIERLNHLANRQHEHLLDYETVRKAVERELAIAYGNEEAAAAAAIQHGTTYTTTTTGNNHHNSSNSNASFTSTLLACGDSFTSVFCPGATTGTALSSSSGEYKTAFPGEIDNDGEGPQYFPDETRHQVVDHRYPTTTTTTTPGRGPLILQNQKSRQPSSLSLIDKEVVVVIREEEKAAAPSPPFYVVGMGIPMEEQQQQPIRRRRPHYPEDDRPKLTPKPSRTNSDYDLQRALFVSGLQVELPTKVTTTTITDVFAPPGAKKRLSTFGGGGGVPMDMLKQCYHEDFDALRTSSRVLINQVPTYQGRIPDSTNGCTVIAPLLCIHHFHNTDTIPDPGLPDQVIVQVIDEETPNILPAVRETLGLTAGAFLIPADAHC
jgi:hypothetical protein